MTNKTYQISVKEDDSPKEIAFKFSNHDDLIELVDHINKLALFDIETSTTFVIGLKLLGEVLLKNKEDDLFLNFYPEFHKFMRKLKSVI